MNDTIAEQAYRVVLEERIHDLLVTRRWYRTHRWADWPDLRKESEVELRALLKVARTARRLLAARPDPMDAFKSYRDFTESEKAQAWGR